MMNIETIKAMNWLRSRGVATLTLGFSGGNDEGGVDSVDAVDATGAPVDVSALRSSAYQDWQTKQWVVYTWQDGKNEQRPATPEEIAATQITEVLEAPIYARWGGFGGEFHVYGTLVWDVATGTSEMHGSVSHEAYEDF